MLKLAASAQVPLFHNISLSSKGQFGKSILLVGKISVLSSKYLYGTMT